MRHQRHVTLFITLIIGIMAVIFPAIASKHPHVFTCTMDLDAENRPLSVV